MRKRKWPTRKKCLSDGKERDKEKKMKEKKTAREWKCMRKTMSGIMFVQTFFEILSVEM